MNIEDIDDENDRALASVIYEFLNKYSFVKDELIAQIAATNLVDEIKKDGWIPPEEMNRAKASERAAQVRIEDKDKGIAVLEAECMRLQKQIDSMMRGSTRGYGGSIISSPGITWTSSTTTAPTAAQIAMVYGNGTRNVA